MFRNSPQIILSHKQDRILSANRWHFLTEDNSYLASASILRCCPLSKQCKLSIFYTGRCDTEQLVTIYGVRKPFFGFGYSNTQGSQLNAVKMKDLELHAVFSFKTNTSNCIERVLQEVLRREGTITPQSCDGFTGTYCTLF